MSDKNRADDPRRGGLISDAQGEFVRESPGGAFDPRTFRHGGGDQTSSPGEEPGEPVQPLGEPGEEPVGEPAMDGTRMVAPGEEIDKAG